MKKPSAWKGSTRFGTTDEVLREVRERIRVQGKNGGYICGPDPCIMPDVPLENVLVMYAVLIFSVSDYA
jgi:hypothetical protein